MDFWEAKNLKEMFEKLDHHVQMGFADQFRDKILFKEPSRVIFIALLKGLDANLADTIKSYYFKYSAPTDALLEGVIHKRKT